MSVAAVISAMVLIGATAAVADSDLDNDGFDDLVVGVPSEGVGQVSQAGAINVLDGSSSGIVAKGDQLLDQSDVGGTVEDGDRFGNAIAHGDFDGDGFDDVAVGAPTESINGRSKAGVVHVIYGSRRGANGSDTQVLSQIGKWAGVHETSDFFGAVLASGNLNGDRYDDLVVGIPGENIGAKTAAGAIWVAYGGPDGFTKSRSTFLSQRGKVPNKAEKFDSFGSSLAVGDFNDDDIDDIVIGTPGEDVFGAVDAGVITVLYGATGGVKAAGDIFNQLMLPFEDNAPGDAFGYAVAAGDFNGDGIDDIAASARREDVQGVVDAGAVVIIPGSATGATLNGASLITQTSVDPSQNETGDRFGHSLATGRFDDDPYDDLAIGVPFEDVQALEDAGRVLVIYGSGAGLNTGRTQNITQNAFGESAAPDEWFGDGLRVGNYDRGGIDDLAVSAPLEDIGGRADNGLVVVIYGSSPGLRLTGVGRFQQGRPGVAGTAEAGDRFGEGL